jgi:hypothetical protein
VGCLTKAASIVLSDKPENIDNRGWAGLLTHLELHELFTARVQSARGERPSDSAAEKHDELA